MSDNDPVAVILSDVGIRECCRCGGPVTNRQAYGTSGRDFICEECVNKDIVKEATNEC